MRIGSGRFTATSLSRTRLWDAVTSDQTYQALAPGFLIAAIDTAGPEVTYWYRYQVFKVPSILVLGADGSARGRLIGPNSAAEVVTFLKQQQ